MLAASLALCAALLRLPPHLVGEGRGGVLRSPGVYASEELIRSLHDPLTGKSLKCYIECSLEKDGQTFAALSPVDVPVSLAQVSQGKLLAVEEETAAMISAAQSACEMVQITLRDTPMVLTVVGEGLADADFEDDHHEDEEDDDGGEEAIVLTEFEHQGDMMFVVQILDPLYLIGKRATGDKFVIPSDAELAQVSGEIEEMLSTLADELEDAEELEIDGQEHLP